MIHDSISSRILLTGSSGFIGRNLHEGLKDRYHILAPTHRELDLLDKSALTKYIAKHRIDTVIHTAVGKGENTFHHTVRMFLNIYDNIAVLKKFIHFGSGAEYDKTRDLIKVKETDWGKYIPKSDYGLAKFACHKIGRQSKKVINLRLFGVYGKYENYLFTFISNSIVKTLFQIPIIIKQDAIFDYLYIDDLVKITRYFLTHNNIFPEYNLTPDRSIKLSTLTRSILQYVNVHTSFEIANSSMNYRYSGSNYRLHQEIPKLKFSGFNSTIPKLINYYLTIKKGIYKSALTKDLYFSKCTVRI